MDRDGWDLVPGILYLLGVPVISDMDIHTYKLLNIKN